MDSLDVNNRVIARDPAERDRRDRKKLCKAVVIAPETAVLTVPTWN